MPDSNLGQIAISCTIIANIITNLIGSQPQEHRNMPFDDAMSLVAKAFEKHTMSKNRQDGSAEGNSSIGSGVGAKDAHSKTGSDGGNNQLPNDVRNVIGFLLDQRPLSVMEYDKLIKWLAQQRLSVLQAEYGENIPLDLATPPVGPPVDPAVKAKQMEIQDRIINILNRPKPQPQQQTSSALLFGGQTSGSTDNPLQRAIDNLIRTGPNLLNQAAGQPSNSGGGNRSGTGSNPGSSSGGGIGDSYSGYGLTGHF